MDAEAAVLSACVLSVEACDEAMSILAADDFYADANRRIFEAINELARAGTEVDIVSISAKLRDRGRLDQVGGSPYLAQIIDATPSVANIKNHCLLVLNAARIRRAGAIAHQFAAEAYGEIPDPQEWLQRFEMAAYKAATDVRAESTAATYGEAAKEAFDIVTEASKSKATTVGWPTGFKTLDDDVGGLVAGDLWLVGGRPGSGKAQPLDAPVLTPTGWRAIGDLAFGDPIMGADGKVYRVTGVFDQGEKDVFLVTLSDGGTTECCDEHLWLTRSRADRRKGQTGSVKPLSEIRKKIKRSTDGGLNHSIPFVRPIEFAEETELEIDPWLLGIYLGDGYMGCNVMFSNPENDIRGRLAAGLPDSVLVPVDSKDMRVRGPDFLHRLKRVGLKGKRSWEKFIPRPYLLASVAAREAILQGLCDADGFVTGGASIEYVTVSPQLRDDIAFLVGSLGGRVTWQAKATHYTKNGERHDCREAYRMILSFPQGDIVPVSSVKHLGKYKAPLGRLTERYIASVEPSRRTKCRCIAVSAPDHLYVTNDFIVTHNTTWATQALEHVASLTQPNGAPVGVIMFSMEMKKRQLLLRSLSRKTEIPFHNLRLGRLLPEQWRVLSETGRASKQVPMIIDDGRGLTPHKLRSKVRRYLATLRNMFGSELVLGGVGIDYIQLMNANQGNDNRATELGEISKDAKQQAGEFETTYMALSSLKRPDNKIKVPKPQMTDLRDSGALDFDADVIMMLHRDDSYREKHEVRDNLADLIVCKSRNSDTSTHMAEFDGRFYGFYPLGTAPFHRDSSDPEDWRDRM